jgi:uncharacterized repeat protein (TIGR01451 family)
MISHLASLSHRIVVTRSCVLAAAFVAWVILCAPAAGVVGAKPAWTVTVMSGPTNFAPGDDSGRDTYVVTATNSGGAPTNQGETVTLTDTLPPGITLETEGKGPLEALRARDNAGNPKLVCSEGPPIVCEDAQANFPIRPGESVVMNIPVDVSEGALSGSLNEVGVSGGGAQSSAASLPTTISSTPASFGFPEGRNGIDGIVSGPDGATVTQAGSHPYQATLNFALNNELTPVADVASGEPKTVIANLPPGFIVNPKATATRCTETQLETKVKKGEQETDGCPASSQIGTVRVTAGELGFPGSQTAKIYNMVPPHGWAADLGFDAAGVGLYVHLRGGVRTGADYGLTATAGDVLQQGALLAFSTTLWGDPSDPSHDAVRGTCLAGGKNLTGELCPGESTNTALLTLPTKCSGPLTTTIEAESWQEPNKFVPDDFESHDSANPPNPIGVTGCSALDFSPSIAVKPDTTVAESPSGLNVDLHIPQEEGVNGLAEADLKDALVRLPPGMTVNPAEAGGLQACSAAQIALHESAAATCPDASKIGSVEVDTPLLDHPLPGSIYLAQPFENPFGSSENPGGSLLAIYVSIDDPETGVIVKLAGHVEADPGTGQLTTTFLENPQLPFTDFKLKFFGGPRAPLIAPAQCGMYQTSTSLTPWSGTPAVAPSDTFSIGSGCDGGFAPTFGAGTTSNQAGSYSPLGVTFSRGDREQRLGGVTVRMPPGLLGKVAGVPQCPEPQANAGTCSAASTIGTVTAAAGAGPEPFYVPEAGQPANPVYLTGPYKGAPFGLSIVTHALAGPFDLGQVVVRAAIFIDSRTAQITVVSDPLPTILQGIPLDLRTVNVIIDRPGFALNPTSCEPAQIGATFVSLADGSSTGFSRFQAAGCQSLPFNPSFTVATQGKTSKANGASLTVKVAQAIGEANVHKVDITLPAALPARLTTLQKACTEAQFNNNPAGCPPESVIGTATAITPLLDTPLTGPAYLVSHGGAAFPDVLFLLQGEGVRIELDGGTDIKKGITHSSFDTVPDAPISSFITSLPEGLHSVLAANGNLCKPTKIVTKRTRVPLRRHGHLVRRHGHPVRVPITRKLIVAAPLAMPTVITAQDGARIASNTKIAVTGCPKASAKVAGASSKRRTGRPTLARSNTIGQFSEHR